MRRRSRIPFAHPYVHDRVLGRRLQRVARRVVDLLLCDVGVVVVVVAGKLLGTVGRGTTQDISYQHDSCS